MTDRLTLVSDFREFYDHHFDLASLHPDAPVLTRMSTLGPPRQEQFRTLASLGVVVPPFGRVRDLVGSRYASRTKVVVYTDQDAHRGEGKRLLDGGTAFGMHSEALCSLYIPQHDDRPTSYRYLQIGRVACWLVYRSDDEWRSNCGNVEIEVLCAPHERWYDARFATLPHPLLAVDYVVGSDGRYLAVDLNVAPGLKGTGIEAFLEPADVVRLLKEALPRPAGVPA